MERVPQTVIRLRIIDFKIYNRVSEAVTTSYIFLKSIWLQE
jgi:hypothetical protein